MRSKFQRLATFNCQGLNADEFYESRLATIIVQETRIKETGLWEFTSSDGKKVCLYNSCSGAKSIRAVVIITTESTDVTFNPVSERICTQQQKLE